MGSLSSALQRGVFFRIDDDFVDRLSRLHTPLALLVVALFGLVAQHPVLHPVACWTPAYFTGGHQDYTERICGAKDVYYPPETLLLPGENSTSAVYPVPLKGYYSCHKWVPPLLVFQALLAFVPSLPWRLLNCRTDLNLRAVVEGAGRCLMPPNAETHNGARDKELRYIANLIGRRDGNLSCSPLLVITFLLSKLLYFISVVLQLVLLDHLSELSHQSQLPSDRPHWTQLPFLTKLPFAVKIIERFLLWQRCSLLPSVILCDFEIRQMGNLHRHTVQCTLPLNHLYAIIFFLLWCWFMALALLILLNALLWIVRLVYNSVAPTRELCQQLLAMGVPASELGELDSFKKQRIQLDGWLALKLIGLNMSEALAAEVLLIIWTQHLRDRGASVPITGPSAPAVYGPGSSGAPTLETPWPGGMEMLPEGVRYRHTDNAMEEGKSGALAKYAA